MKRRNFLGLGALALAAVPGAAALIGREHPVTKALVMGDDRLRMVDIERFDAADWNDARIYGLARTHWYTRAEIEAMYGPGGAEFLGSDPRFGLVTIDHDPMLADLHKSLDELKAQSEALQSSVAAAGSVFAALAAGAMSATNGDQS